MLKVHPIAGNHQWLDGGAMFGNAPRALWERWCQPDDAGRIELACRSVLVDEGDRKVLLEAGVGAFFSPKLRKRYGVREPEHLLIDTLERLDVTDADIDVVVLSHLHFDHAGGLLAPYQEGADLRLLFPNATFVVGREALERARAPHARDQASFVRELPGLLEKTGRLAIVDPESEPSPEVLGDRYTVEVSDGHTPGMMLTTVRGKAQHLFYASDLVPGVPWVHVPITMGYDRYPERLVDEKRALFERLVEEKAWVVFTHDAKTARARLDRDDDGRFRAVDEHPDEPWDLDADE